MSDQPNSPFQIKLPLVLFIGLAAGVLIGSNITSRKASPGTGDDMQKLREVLGLIKEDYVDTTNTAPLVEEAINLMLEKLDPHSVY
ncbi:MAG: peptidase S41, partial [Cyclobacteriaceae bacterium]